MEDSAGTVNNKSMRKSQKKQIENNLNLLDRAHGAIKKALETKNMESALTLLEQTQDLAIQMGGMIEEALGEDFATVEILESYCEQIYQTYEMIRQQQALNINKTCKSLQKELIRIENSVKNDIQVRMTAAFLPYKASMWDSLESVWKAADADPACDAYVIPIPYFDKNPDGSFREEHYEGGQYPAYVPITRYDEYDLETEHPDVIYIHNPYDECNYVTSVHPHFYSKNLIHYTDELVYITYFILGEIDPDDQKAIDEMKHFCFIPGTIYAHRVIVQSEAMRKIYIREYRKAALEMGLTGGHTDREFLEKKFLGTGSPKIDKVLNTRKEDLEIPSEWLKVIEKPDGRWKKVVFYNTSVSELLRRSEEMLRKMESVFEIFKENQPETALLWRPHPLIRSTIASMRPQLLVEYDKAVRKYQEGGWGIYDDSADLERAIEISDAYYGDESSVVQLCMEKGMPVMLQNVETQKSARYEFDIAATEAICCYEGSYYFVYMSEPFLCKMDRETLKCELLYLFDEKDLQERLYRKIVPYQNKLFLIPFISDKIAIYDITTHNVKFIPLNEDYVDVRWQQTLVSSKFEDALVKDQFLYMVPHSYHAIIKLNMETLEMDEIPLGVKGTERFCYCCGSGCIAENKVLFPVRSEGSLCIFDVDTFETARVYPSGVQKKYTNIFYIDNKVWLIPEKIYEGIDIWDVDTGKIEKNIFMSEKINTLSREHKAADFARGFVSGRNLYLLAWGMDSGIAVNLDSGDAELWELPMRYNREEFPLYLYYLRNAAVLQDGEDTLICGLRGEWTVMNDYGPHIIERQSVWSRELTEELTGKEIVLGAPLKKMTLRSFLQAENPKQSRVQSSSIGKDIYECMSR